LKSLSSQCFKEELDLIINYDIKIGLGKSWKGEERLKENTNKGEK
jgi:hypothetical protein